MFASPVPDPWPGIERGVQQVFAEVSLPTLRKPRLNYLLGHRGGPEAEVWTSPNKWILAEKKSRSRTSGRNHFPKRSQRRRYSVSAAPVPTLARFGLSASPSAPETCGSISAGFSGPDGAPGRSLPALRPGSGSAASSLSESVCCLVVVKSRKVVFASLFLALERFRPGGWECRDRSAR